MRILQVAAMCDDFAAGYSTVQESYFILLYCW